MIAFAFGFLVVAALCFLVAPWAFYFIDHYLSWCNEVQFRWKHRNGG